MLGDGLGALEPFSAFLATVLISRHGLTMMTQAAGHAECAAVARFAKSHCLLWLLQWLHGSSCSEF